MHNTEPTIEEPSCPYRPVELTHYTYASDQLVLLITLEVITNNDCLCPAIVCSYCWLMLVDVAVTCVRNGQTEYTQLLARAYIHISRNREYLTHPFMRLCRAIAISMATL